MAPLTPPCRQGPRIRPQAAGYANVPGIWNVAQIAGWKTITDAVRANGLHIFLQLWALGRGSSVMGLLLERESRSREITTAELREYIQLYSKAASNAIEAGFDSVTDAVVETIGAERRAVRISTWSKYQDIDDENRTQSSEVLVLREAVGDRPYIAVGGVNGMDAATSNEMVQKYGDLVAFGRHFIANPESDLPLRLKEGLLLTCYNRDTFYATEAAAGYLDYPFANNVIALQA
ncbi:hypothetical protein V8E53_003886 [Lactarius tabidus]